MDEAGICRPFKIAASQPHKNTWRISLADVVTREDAEGLIGCAVLIHRSHLPALDEDTFYWADLLGMAVITGSDEYLGRITDIIPTGANDVYVVSADAGDNATGTDGADAGGAPREILIPALASVVLAVDTDRRTMTVELPEGLDG
jgi:16S rRNA processing protein RimM